MLNILYAVSYYKPAYLYGGVISCTSVLCETLVKFGADVTVLTTNANGAERLDVPLEKPVIVDGVRVYYFPVRGKYFSSFFYSPSLVRAFSRMIKQYDIAILDTFLTHLMGPASSCSLEEKVPYVIPLHGQLLPWALKNKRKKKWIYLSLIGRRYLNNSAALLCLTVEEKRAVQKLGFKSPLLVLPNGINISSWSQIPPRGKYRRILGIPDDALVMLFLGRLHRVKNPEILLEVMDLINRQDVHLIFAGPDEENLEMKLRSKAEKTGCIDKVHFTGLLSGENLLQILSDADLMVMPSFMEGFGMAAVEALAAGVPVLLSENVPIGKWVEQAGAGRVAASNPQAFTQAVRELIQDPLALKVMGEKGKELARQRFDISVVARQSLEQFESIVSSGYPIMDDAQE